MAELRIRDVDDTIVDELKARAKRNGHTLGEELRTILADEAHRPRLEVAERLKQLRASIESKHGILPDSTDIIREMRDSRG